MARNYTYRMVTCEKCNEEYGNNNIPAHKKVCAGIGFKTCSTCKVIKPFELFGKRAKGHRGFNSECNACGVIRRDAYRIKSYGLNKDEYQELKEYQNNLCAICGKTPDQGTIDNKRLGIDHDHNTNIPRGLLCSNCNTGLGMFQDSIELLKSAIKYLKEPPMQQIARLKETESGDDACPIA